MVLGFGVLGSAICIYVFLSIGLDTLVEIARLIFIVGIALAMLFYSMVMGQQLWQNKDHHEVIEFVQLGTDELSHHIGLVTSRIAYSDIDSVDDKTSEDSIILVLKDKGMYSLAVKKRKEFTLALKNEVARAT